MASTVKSRNFGEERAAPSDTDAEDDISAKEELSQLLEELRILLPGTQVLLGFLLSVPFTSRFTDLSVNQERALFTAFISSAIGVVFLIAPSAIHRIQRQPESLEALIRTSTRLALTASGFLVLATAASVFLVVSLIYTATFAAVFAAIIAALAVWLWYGLPLVRKF